MTGNQDPSFERIHPDDAVGCAAAEAACRRRHNVTLALLGTLADSGRASFDDDRRLFMAWQVTRLLAPSWNEPPAWFVQRHIDDRRDIEHNGTQAGWLHRPHRRSSLPMECDYPRVSNWVMLGPAGRSSAIRWAASAIFCSSTMWHTDLRGWSPGHLAGDVLVTSSEPDTRRVLEAA
jgi:hypothetical protein